MPFIENVPASVDLPLYHLLRRQGVRAVVAFGIAKYGMDFVLEYLMDGGK